MRRENYVEGDESSNFLGRAIDSILYPTYERVRKASNGLMSAGGASVVYGLFSGDDIYTIVGAACISIGALLKKENSIRENLERRGNANSSGGLQRRIMPSPKPAEKQWLTPEEDRAERRERM